VLVNTWSFFFCAHNAHWDSCLHPLKVHDHWPQHLRHLLYEVTWTLSSETVLARSLFSPSLDIVVTVTNQFRVVCSVVMCRIYLHLFLWWRLDIPSPTDIPGVQAHWSRDLFSGAPTTKFWITLWLCALLCGCLVAAARTTQDAAVQTDAVIVLPLRRSQSSSDVHKSHSMRSLDDRRWKVTPGSLGGSSLRTSIPPLRISRRIDRPEHQNSSVFRQY